MVQEPCRGRVPDPVHPAGCSWVKGRTRVRAAPQPPAACRSAPRRPRVSTSPRTTSSPAGALRLHSGGEGARTSAQGRRSPPSPTVPGSRAPLTRGTGGCAVVTVRGCLGLTTVPRLRERLLRVSHGPGSSLVLDLSGVTSCDALGLGLLVATARRARSLGGGLCLLAPSPSAAAALGAAGLTRLLHVHSDLGTATGTVFAAPAPEFGKAA
ncbi:STAS domain-containing protein [Streptomyces sp. BPTC-684]|uniref:STAS domain-containing protein n=1 Tax=Streptomyces sp. BPTC-684 TaxID=3043734 RepID=UPI0024B15DED|nr:STAS domain-containing protein [Streptomyces sp. BPTC-684]WHM40653.1 STAS domain-containing protein [Streptomyces sp. BPTC-684]